MYSCRVGVGVGVAVSPGPGVTVSIGLAVGDGVGVPATVALGSTITDGSSTTFAPLAELWAPADAGVSPKVATSTTAANRTRSEAIRLAEHPAPAPATHKRDWPRP